MIRVFVGCAANHEDAESQSVLEYTLRKHCSDDLEITWMKLSRDPSSPFYCDVEKGLGWNTTKWATPFSGFRWAVPALCNFEGRAIYTDSDVIFRQDVSGLWGQKFSRGRPVMGKGGSSWRLCVSMWDCAAAKDHLLSLSELRRNADAHRQMSHKFSGFNLIHPFEGNWNCIDGENYARLDDPAIMAIHYSSMPHQPHHERAAKRLADVGLKHWFDGKVRAHWRKDLVELFESLLEEAQTDYPVSRYTQDPLFGPYKKLSLVNHVGLRATG